MIEKKLCDYERVDDQTVSFLQLLLFTFGVQSNRKLARPRRVRWELAQNIVTVQPWTRNKTHNPVWISAVCCIPCPKTH